MTGNINNSEVIITLGVGSGDPCVEVIRCKKDDLNTKKDSLIKDD